MPDEFPDSPVEFSELESHSHEPIMRAVGSPVSGRLIVLVTAILVVVVLAATIFAFSQGVFAHPTGSY